MSEQSQPDYERWSTKMYFVMAYVFLFLLALLWSVGAAFVYFFSGGGAIFLYLGIQSYKKSHVKSERSNTSGRFNDGRHSSPLPDVKPDQTGAPVKLKVPKVVAVFFGFMFFIVFISVFIAVFSDDDDSEYYYQLGNSYYEAGKYDSAAMYLRQSLNRDPESIDALISFGNTKLALIQNDSAIIFYDRVLALESENIEAAYQKGRVLYFNKDYEQCIPLLEELVSRDSSRNDAIQLVGDSFYNQQRYDSALSWYEKAYSTGFRNTYLCYLMGYIYETKNNRERAVALYKEAVEFDDTIADLLERLGALVPGIEGEEYRVKAVKLKAEQ